MKLTENIYLLLLSNTTQAQIQGNRDKDFASVAAGRSAECARERAKTYRDLTEGLPWTLFSFSFSF
jgi:hypothetical protein